MRFGKVVSYSVTVSPSVINLHLDWEVYEEEMVQILQWGGYLLEDASGKRLTDAEWMRSCGSSVPEYDEDGKCTTFAQDLEIVGFDASSENNETDSCARGMECGRRHDTGFRSDTRGLCYHN